MNKDEFLQLEEKAAPDEKIKLRILYDAMIETLKDYKSKYSQRNLRAWQAAETALDDFANNLKAIDNAGIEFKTVKEVVTYLQSKAPLTVQSSVYNHVKKGFLKKNNNGKFSLIDVDIYATQYVKNYDQKDGIDSGEHNKFEADARKSAAQADHWEIKTKILTGEYIERAAFERALARRATIFKSDLDNLARSIPGEIISQVKGDALYTPDLIEFFLLKFEEITARYAEKIEFEIPKAVDFKKLEAIEN